MPRNSTTELQPKNLAETLAGVLNAADSTVALDLLAVWTASEVCVYEG